MGRTDINRHDDSNCLELPQVAQMPACAIWMGAIGANAPIAIQTDCLSHTALYTEATLSRLLVPPRVLHH
jgi:hypothetical protein